MRTSTDKSAQIQHQFATSAIYRSHSGSSIAANAFSRRLDAVLKRIMAGNAACGDVIIAFCAYYLYAIRRRG